MKFKKVFLFALCGTLLSFPCIASASTSEQTGVVATSTNTEVKHITDTEELKAYCSQNGIEYDSSLEEMIIVTDYSLINDTNVDSSTQPYIFSHFFIQNLSHAYTFTSHDPADMLFGRDYPGGIVEINDSYETQSKITGNFKAEAKDFISTEVGIENGATVDVAVKWTSKKYDHAISVQVYPKYVCYDGELWAAELFGGSSNDYKVDDFTAMRPVGYAVGVFDNSK